MAEDLPLELLEVGARIDSELLHQLLSRRAKRLQRLLLPARPIERKDVLSAEALAVRLRRDQLLGPGDQLLVPAGRKLGVVRELECLEAPVFELRRLRLGDRLAAEVGKR